MVCSRTCQPILASSPLPRNERAPAIQPTSSAGSGPSVQCSRCGIPSSLARVQPSFWGTLPPWELRRASSIRGPRVHSLFTSFVSDHLRSVTISDACRLKRNLTGDAFHRPSIRPPEVAGKMVSFFGRDGAPSPSHFSIWQATDGDSRAFARQPAEWQSAGWREDASKAPSLPPPWVSSVFLGAFFHTKEDQDV